MNPLEDQIEVLHELKDESEVFCPACDGEGVVLGALGRLIWYRCRQCGIEFNREKEQS